MRNLLLLLLGSCSLITLTACKPTGADTSAPVATAVVKESIPGKIEITNVDVTLLEDSARFKVQYKFLEGAPTKYYMCTFAFPGSEKKGLKMLDAWEMKPEGTIVAGVEMGAEKLSEFTVSLAEADSPDQGYRENSNVFTGKLDYPGK